MLKLFMKKIENNNNNNNEKDILKSVKENKNDMN